jgi:hypothetical protein
MVTIDIENKNSDWIEDDGRHNEWHNMRGGGGAD